MTGLAQKGQIGGMEQLRGSQGVEYDSVNVLLRCCLHVWECTELRSYMVKRNALQIPAEKILKVKCSCYLDCTRTHKEGQVGLIQSWFILGKVVYGDLSTVGSRTWLRIPFQNKIKDKLKSLSLLVTDHAKHKPIVLNVWWARECQVKWNLNPDYGNIDRTMPTLHTQVEPHSFQRTAFTHFCWGIVWWREWIKLWQSRWVFRKGKPSG